MKRMAFGLIALVAGGWALALAAGSVRSAPSLAGVRAPEVAVPEGLSNDSEANSGTEASFGAGVLLGAASVSLRGGVPPRGPQRVRMAREPGPRDSAPVAEQAFDPTTGEGERLPARRVGGPSRRVLAKLGGPTAQPAGEEVAFDPASNDNGSPYSFRFECRKGGRSPEAFLSE